MGETIGDRYYARRKTALDRFLNDWRNDRVINTIIRHKIKPVSILEIGCANGWRLKALYDIFGCHCVGIDPSEDAIGAGKKDWPFLDLRVGIASNLPDGEYDIVIFGFCLYLCGREDLFKIAFEADRVLMDRGHLIVLDFHPQFPYSNVNPDGGCDTYKMIYGNMFMWHPYYKLIVRQIFANPEEKTEHLSVYMFKKEGL